MFAKLNKNCLFTTREVFFLSCKIQFSTIEGDEKNFLSHVSRTWCGTTCRITPEKVFPLPRIRANFVSTIRLECDVLMLMDSLPCSFFSRFSSLPVFSFIVTKAWWKLIYNSVIFHRKICGVFIISSHEKPLSCKFSLLYIFVVSQKSRNSQWNSFHFEYMWKLFIPSPSSQPQKLLPILNIYKRRNNFSMHLVSTVS
jgi:hypothetical protein